MNLVIVESPAKAKTIQKYLGKDFVVKSSYGHIRDLPKSDLGVDPDKDFKPEYIIPDKAKKNLATLRKSAATADAIYFATDEDREGEAIAWHLLEALKIKKGTKIHRIVFHEITKSAILEAIANPRTIDDNLVNAQQARRVLDRLVGYELSPLIWKKVRYGLSAGRVQSVAVRLVVERERAINAFEPEEYWRIHALTETDSKDEINFEVIKESDKKITIPNQDAATKIVNTLKDQPFVIKSVTKKRISRKPAPPFTTSTLQQEASRKLGFSVKQTMRLAQQLYEGVEVGGEQIGLITYMRTDSHNLAKQALADIKTHITTGYGEQYSLSTPRQYKAGKSSQEAHEAIRPTSFTLTPETAKTHLDRNQHRLYQLIWQRTIACQMADAKLDQTAVDVQIDQYLLRANGQTVAFDGFMKVYIEGKDKISDTDDKGKNDNKANNDRLLPEVSEGEKLTVKEINPTQHFTKPPARYTEASLVKRLEADGIGRPSTYAPTIATIETRGYIEKDSRRLRATDTGMLVTDFLTEHFENIVDYEFTANIENELDDIAAGDKDWVPMLRDFYDPFRKNIDTKSKDLKKEDVLKERLLGSDPDTGKDIIVRHGRFGPFVQVGEWSEEDRKAKTNKPKRASIPPDTFFETITLEQALVALSLPRTLGQYQGDEVIVTTGRYGPYLKMGKDNISLPDDVNPYTIELTDLDEVIKQANELKEKAKKPIAELGTDPESGGEIIVKHGRYGPYVTDGTTNASIRKGTEPEDIDHAKAIDMLAKKRSAPKRTYRKKK